MINPYQPEPAEIIKIMSQTANIKLFRFEFTNKTFEKHFYFSPGQIIELSIPGFGEAPFAPCGKSGVNYLELCVRAAGKLTDKLHTMKVGDIVGVRGPYGHGWPIKVESEKLKVKSDDKRNLLIVVGGLGLIPLRSLILDKNKYFTKGTKIQIFYGAKTPDDFLFKKEYNAWSKNGVEVDLTVDKECVGWDGCVGLVTALFDKKRLVADAQAFLCGPPIMYKFVLKQLETKHFRDEDIFLSLERRMHCGLGVCQHCAVGPFYTCKDGPVFQYSQIKNIKGAI